MKSLARGLKTTARAAWMHAIVGLQPASPAPYGSHVPVLMLCAAILRPKRVLELGCGNFSTPLFLDSELCPSVEHVTSLETDAEWLQRLRAVHGQDRRWSSEFAEMGTEEWLREGQHRVELSKYDLIFVDDLQASSGRPKTLSALLSMKPSCPVVVHDVEEWRLRLRIWAHGSYVVFDAFTPQTGICNCTDGGARAKLHLASGAVRAMRRGAQSCTSLADWIRVGRAAVDRVTLDVR